MRCRSLCGTEPRGAGLLCLRLCRLICDEPFANTADVCQRLFAFISVECLVDEAGRLFASASEFENLSEVRSPRASPRPMRVSVDSTSMTASRASLSASACCPRRASTLACTWREIVCVAMSSMSPSSMPLRAQASASSSRSSAYRACPRSQRLVERKPRSGLMGQAPRDARNATGYPAGSRRVGQATVCREMR